MEIFSHKQNKPHI